MPRSAKKRETQEMGQELAALDALQPALAEALAAEAEVALAALGVGGNVQQLGQGPGQ